MNDVVFLVDVDNTLLDNDRLIADLRAHLDEQFGAESAAAYWIESEKLRDAFGFVDYLGALQRFRDTLDHEGPNDHRLLSSANFLLDYPFADRVYPGAIEAMKRLSRQGPVVILSDGDVVFQPRKIRRSGLWDAVEGHVLIYIHKEEMLASMQRHYPAQRYVMIDDKPRILTEMKKRLGDRLVTVFPRQGHYANDPTNAAKYPAADVSIDRISELLTLDLRPLLGNASLESPT